MTEQAMVQLFSTQCLLCAHEFTSSDRVWTHMYPHIIDRHPKISMYHLGKLLNEFIEACKRHCTSHFDDPLVQATTNIFAVQVLALHYPSNGSGGRASNSATSGDLATLDAGSGPEEPDTQGHHTRKGRTFTIQAATSGPNSDAAKERGQQFQRSEQCGQDAHSPEPSKRATAQMFGTRFRICAAYGMRARRTVAQFGTSFDAVAPSVLMQHVLLQLHQRFLTLEAHEKDTAAWKTMVEAGILTAQGDMPYLTWDSQSRWLVPNKQTPLKLTQVKEMLCQLMEAFKDVGLVLKFHALKKANPQADPHQTNSTQSSRGP